MTSKLKEQIAEIYELDAKRTQGEWLHKNDLQLIASKSGDIVLADGEGYWPLGSVEDVSFVTKAPQMVSIIRALEAKLEKARYSLKEAVQYVGGNEESPVKKCISGTGFFDVDKAEQTLKELE